MLPGQCISSSMPEEEADATQVACELIHWHTKHELTYPHFSHGYVFSFGGGILSFVIGDVLELIFELATLQENQHHTV